MIVNGTLRGEIGMNVVGFAGPCYPAWMYTPDTLRAARALLNWTREELARRSGLSPQLVQKIEDGKSKRPAHETVKKIIGAFLSAGVEFIEPGEPLPPGGAGVRLKEAPPDMKGGE
ncbi:MULTISPECIES: helix-turn-helix transcriptional regulator [Azospirillum]|uniref:Helix-turn-helix transcriptional regulator n=3 Tax=root TaxID=1 RepID=A0ABU4NZ86_AZOBR|nr:MULTISPECIES: helix-turn-helix transcriptional regulator [Azospirillum]MDW7555347.1 helix-turn-helix transcriptional regulator [Azospirillum brasilense]MDW7595245.1 helix-turn-helix transcriptional regulator [Azospirillum brasilense]MDW7630399.1 helix-turn-helix transcriptional regulator [Azospirillum brasilense]MDX5949766.1 helix-turn-helix transcriptional regulator [Azospirillum brasilense]